MRAQRTAGGIPPPGSSPSPSAAAIFGSFLRLGITAFGGPAIIAHIKEMSVKRNKWLTEETFKDGVMICQSVPGATAMQMEAYVGLRARGFASLPLMFHEVVNVKGWLDGKTFMDGIALGQVTPGPIIITPTFVGYLVRGFPGALAATMAIFTPSFVVLVAATPLFDRLKNAKYFSETSRGILASFVGLFFYMTIRFAVADPWEPSKVLFGIAVVFALARKMNILHIVLIGSVHFHCHISVMKS